MTDDSDPRIPHPDFSPVVPEPVGTEAYVTSISVLVDEFFLHHYEQNMATVLAILRVTPNPHTALPPLCDDIENVAADALLQCFKLYGYQWRGLRESQWISNVVRVAYKMVLRIENRARQSGRAPVVTPIPLGAGDADDHTLDKILYEMAVQISSQELGPNANQYWHAVATTLEILAGGGDTGVSLATEEAVCELGRHVAQNAMPWRIAWTIALTHLLRDRPPWPGVEVLVSSPATRTHLYAVVASLFGAVAIGKDRTGAIARATGESVANIERGTAALRRLQKDLLRMIGSYDDERERKDGVS